MASSIRTLARKALKLVKRDCPELDELRAIVSELASRLKPDSTYDRRMFLIELDEAAAVDWLKFAARLNLSEDQLANLQDYHRAIFRKAFTAGVDKAFHIAEACPQCGCKGLLKCGEG